MIGVMSITGNEIIPSTTFELEVQEDSLFCKNEGEHNFRIWLKSDDVVTGYIQGRFRPDHYTGSDDMIVDVFSVETRERYRGQGLSKKLLEMVKAHYGVTALYHSGGFTADGAAAIAKYLTRPEGFGDPTTFKQMGFVMDWDAQQTKY